MGHWITAYQKEPIEDYQTNKASQVAYMERSMGDPANRRIYELLSAEYYCADSRWSGTNEGRFFDELDVKASLDRLMNSPDRMSLLPELAFLAQCAQYVEANDQVYIRFA